MKTDFFLQVLGKFLILGQFFLALSLSANEIKSIDFKQEGEESKLTLEFENGEISAERFHVSDNKQIILDIKNATASPKVLRAFDTSEFSGSVVFVSPYKKPGSETDLRLAIQLRENVRSILNQSNNKLTLSIENRFGVFSQKKIESNEKTKTKTNLTADKKDISRLHIPKSDSIEDILENLTLSGPKKYIGKKISVNVKELSIEDVLKIIADSSGFNIILDQSVKGAPPLTLTLTNLPWDQILDTILELGKLVAIKNGNILIITTLEKATAEKKLLLESDELNKKREPLLTKIFPISFSVLADLATVLSDYKTTRGAIATDTRTNQLIIRDTAESLDRIKKIIETLDTETPQILIEAKIIEANESYKKEMGLASGITFGYDPIKPLPEQSEWTGPGFSFSSVSGRGANTAFGLAIATYKRITDLDFSLKLMESESKGKIISSPRVVTQNRRPATITSTESRSFQTTTNNNGVTERSFTTVTVTLNLNVTPQVTNNGSIIMQLTLAKGGFLNSDDPSRPPTTTNRTINTSVLVDNGSTIVIGGIYNFNKSESHKGIPFLKDIPVVGWLFRTFYNPQIDKTELIIFLTPRIINQEEAGLVNREDAMT